MDAREQQDRQQRMQRAGTEPQNLRNLSASAGRPAFLGDMDNQRNDPAPAGAEAAGAGAEAANNNLPANMAAPRSPARDAEMVDLTQDGERFLDDELQIVGERRTPRRPRAQRPPAPQRTPAAQNVEAHAATHRAVLNNDLPCVRCVRRVMYSRSKLKSGDTWCPGIPGADYCAYCQHNEICLPIDARVKPFVKSFYDGLHTNNKNVLRTYLEGAFREHQNDDFEMVAEMEEQERS